MTSAPIGLVALGRKASRLGSLYALSAGLVVLGSAADLDAGHLELSSADLFAAEMAYLAAALVALAVLHRFRGQSRDVLRLAVIQVLFLLDGLLLQHRLGWSDRPGQMAASLGFAGGVVAVIAMAAILELPLTGSLLGTLLAGVAFVRFGPMLLVGSSEPSWGVVPAYVGLGWLLAGCLLPALLLPRPDPDRARAPQRDAAAIEAWGLAAGLALLLVHFVIAGRAFGLRFHIAYLAPFIVVLGPTLERLLPASRLTPATHLVLAGLPYLGLAVSALELTPGLLGSHWAQAWPFTPFYATLLLTVLIQGLSAHHTGKAGHAYAAAGLLCLTFLGGDLPEVLARACFPAGWQILCVAGVAWTTILLRPIFRPAFLFQLLPAFVLASWAAERGYPGWLILLSTLGWGTLALEALTHTPLSRAKRLTLVFLVTFTSIASLLAHHESRLLFGLAAIQCILAFFVGRWRDDRMLHRLSIAAAATGIAGYALVSRDYHGISYGRLLIQLGFSALLVAVASSLFGATARRRLAGWWSSLAPSGGGGRARP